MEMGRLTEGMLVDSLAARCQSSWLKPHAKMAIKSLATFVVVEIADAPSPCLPWSMQGQSVDLHWGGGSCSLHP
jgi:hypothetical protein